MNPLPSTMQAVRIPDPPARDKEDIIRQAVWQPCPIPQVAVEQVMIHIHATSLNRADSLMMRGLYPAPKGVLPLLGLECAGTICAVGAQVDRWRVGQKVMALLQGGGMAEYAVAHQGACLPWPECFSAAQAGSFMECFAAALYFLQQQAHLQRGESVLIHGGTSGLGTAVLACGRWLGWQVGTTGGSLHKCEQAQALGAVVSVCYQDPDWPEQLLAHRPMGFDVILDPVGGAYLEHHLRLLKPFGRLCTIGLQGGRHGTLDLAVLLTKQLHWWGGTLRALSHQKRSQLLAHLWQQLGDWIEHQQLGPTIDRILPFDELEQAFTLFEQGSYCGKIVLVREDR